MVRAGSKHIVSGGKPIGNVINSSNGLPSGGIMTPVMKSSNGRPPVISGPKTPSVITGELGVCFRSTGMSLRRFVSSLSGVCSRGRYRIVNFSGGIPVVRVLVPRGVQSTVERNLGTRLPGCRFFVISRSVFAVINSVDGSVTGVN